MSVTTSSSGGGGSGGGGGGGFGGSGGSGGSAGCDPTVTGYLVAISPHTTACSSIIYDTNPPTSGAHYPIWAAYKAYSAAVPRGFYVHDLEHGAIVVTYNCPSGCDAELADLTSWLAARPADPLCVAPLRLRVVVTPDPLIPTKFAASAWGWAWTSDCLDLQSLGAFFDAHYGMGSESSCADGVDVMNPPACP